MPKYQGDNVHSVYIADEMLRIAVVLGGPPRRAHNTLTELWDDIEAATEWLGAHDGDVFEVDDDLFPDMAYDLGSA